MGDGQLATRLNKAMLARGLCPGGLDLMSLGVGGNPGVWDLSECGVSGHGGRGRMVIGSSVDRRWDYGALCGRARAGGAG